MHEFIVQNNLQKFVNLTIEELDDEDIIQAIIKRKEELQENFKCLLIASKHRGKTKKKVPAPNAV